MRETLIVGGRELRAYFRSPLAYVFGFAFLALQLYLSVDLVGVIVKLRRARTAAMGVLVVPQQ